MSEVTVFWKLLAGIFLTLSKVVYILNFIIGRGSQAKGTKEERA